MYSFSLPWFLTYFPMVSSFPCCPTVLTKYPSVQNWPPHRFFFTWGHCANISLAVMLFIVRTSCVALTFGTDCTRKCTWSLSVPFSKTVCRIFSQFPGMFLSARCPHRHRTLLADISPVTQSGILAQIRCVTCVCTRSSRPLPSALFLHYIISKGALQAAGYWTRSE